LFENLLNYAILSILKVCLNIFCETFLNETALFLPQSQMRKKENHRVLRFHFSLEKSLCTQRFPEKEENCFAVGIPENKISKNYDNIFNKNKNHHNFPFYFFSCFHFLISAHFLDLPNRRPVII